MKNMRCFVSETRNLFSDDTDDIEIKRDREVCVRDCDRHERQVVARWGIGVWKMARCREVDKSYVLYAELEYAHRVTFGRMNWLQRGGGGAQTHKNLKRL
jgi:ribosomal protein L37AE/L43A